MYNIESLLVSSLLSNNKGAGRTVRVHCLICVFDNHTQRKSVILVTLSIFKVQIRGHFLRRCLRGAVYV